MSFFEKDSDRTLNTDPRLSKLYFTGGTGTAKKIMESTDTPLISECGGNNPCIIVPGDRPWTDKEIEHQAIQIATISKLNGGAVCGRVQTVVTSKLMYQALTFHRLRNQAMGVTEDPQFERGVRVMSSDDALPLCVRATASTAYSERYAIRA